MTDSAQQEVHDSVTDIHRTFFSLYQLLALFHTAAGHKRVTNQRWQDVL